jgi:hypothetical protein
MHVGRHVTRPFSAGGAAADRIANRPRNVTGNTVLDIAPVASQRAIGSNGADILIAVERMGQARVAG